MLFLSIGTYILSQLILWLCLFSKDYWNVFKRSGFSKGSVYKSSLFGGWTRLLEASSEQSLPGDSRLQAPICSLSAPAMGKGSRSCWVPLLCCPQESLVDCLEGFLGGLRMPLHSQWPGSRFSSEVMGGNGRWGLELHVRVKKCLVLGLAQGRWAWWLTPSQETTLWECKKYQHNRNVSASEYFYLWAFKEWENKCLSEHLQLPASFGW